MALMSDWASCSICYEKYDFTNRVPKSLDCRHTFCAPCIIQTCQTRTECPKCRNHINNPSNLHNDLTMIDFMEQRSQADYAKGQGQMRVELEKAETELTDMAAMLEKKAAEQWAKFEKIAEKNRKACKARLDHDIAKVVSSMHKNHIAEQATEDYIQDLAHKAELCDAHKALIRSSLDQRHIVEETFRDCEEMSHRLMQIEAATTDDSEMVYQSYLRHFIAELQTLLSDGGTASVDATTSVLRDITLTPSVRRDHRDYATITKPKTVFGKKGNKPGEFNAPAGVIVLPDGNILVTEYEGNRVQILTQQGEPVLQFGSYGKAKGQFDHPCRAAITADGKIAICDQWNSRLQFFTKTGQYSHTHGSKWPKVGQLLDPRGSKWPSIGQLFDPMDIAIDSRGNLFVVEGNPASNLRRVQVFNKTSKTSRQFGEEHLKRPVGIAVHGDYLVVCDEETNQCELFQTDGQHVHTLCTSGSGPGQLNEPNSAAFDHDQNVLIADYQNQRIQIIKLTREVNHVISNWDSEKPFAPSGIAVTNSGDIIVCDAVNNCIYVF